MHYTKAINLTPESWVLYTNRATAFKKHQEWQLMKEDSEMALRHNSDYWKAHLRLGEALVEIGKKTSS